MEELVGRSVLSAIEVLDAEERQDICPWIRTDREKEERRNALSFYDLYHRTVMEKEDEECEVDIGEEMEASVEETKPDGREREAQRALEYLNDSTNCTT